MRFRTDSKTRPMILRCGSLLQYKEACLTLARAFTTSLASSVTDYKTENGRRYHAFREGSYVFPNDEQEQERLDLIHRMFSISLDERLHIAPITTPRRILDLGTGTGIWAVEIAEKFPNASVIGNDLSAIQPRWVPPNLSFEVCVNSPVYLICQPTTRDIQSACWLARLYRLGISL